MPSKQQSAGHHRKIIEFDDEVWHALALLSRDSLRSLQELADEAFTDLLRKHGRPATLKEALLASKNELAGKKKLAGAKERVAISPQRASNRGRRGRAGKRIS